MLTVSGKNIEGKTFTFLPGQFSNNLRLVITYQVAPIHEELVINASTVEPNIESRNEKVYENTLFSRDDQIFQTLNAGQHEGGGKSLEIRRFGFNLNHGGANKHLNKRLELNFSIDNLTNKHYWETQNYFESRLTPGSPVISRIHATPGYPVTFTAGITLRFGIKN